MSAINKLRQLEAEQAEREKQSQAESNAKFAKLDAERSAIFNALRKKLSEFDGETISRHKIVVKVNRKDQKIDFFVDGNLYLVFDVERLSFHCNCENVCEHEWSYSHLVRVVEKRKRDDLYRSLSIYSEKDCTDENVAAGVFDLMKSYEYRDL